MDSQHVKLHAISWAITHLGSSDVQTLHHYAHCFLTAMHTCTHATKYNASITTAGMTPKKNLLSPKCLTKLNFFFTSDLHLPANFPARGGSLKTEKFPSPKPGGGEGGPTMPQNLSPLHNTRRFRETGVCKNWCGKPWRNNLPSLCWETKHIILVFHAGQQRYNKKISKPPTWNELQHSITQTCVKNVSPVCPDLCWKWTIDKRTIPQKDHTV